MTPWWLALVVACSSESAPPAPKQLEHGDGRRSIDVTVTGAPVTIRGVELVSRGPQTGTVELGYRVEAKDPRITVPARITCRVGDHNVVYLGSTEGKVPGPRLTSLFRPDPFVEVPRACEVAFVVSDKQVAAACLLGGELRDGACPAGTFPPPRRTASSAIELTQPALELHDRSAVISALFTVHDPLPVGRHVAALIRCNDAQGEATGEADFTFVPLQQLPVGRSIYGPLAIFLDRTPAADATCELRIVSRPDPGGGSAPTEQIHARYCLTTAVVRVGGC